MGLPVSSLGILPFLSLLGLFTNTRPTTLAGLILVLLECWACSAHSFPHRLLLWETHLGPSAGGGLSPQALSLLCATDSTQAILGQTVATDCMRVTQLCPVSAALLWEPQGCLALESGALLSTGAH